MRISDWSSDVCSSDLPSPCPGGPGLLQGQRLSGVADHRAVPRRTLPPGAQHQCRQPGQEPSCGRAPGAGGGDRKSVGRGKSVAVRVDIGGSRSIKKKNIRVELNLTYETQINS